MSSLLAEQMNNLCCFHMQKTAQHWAPYVLSFNKKLLVECIIQLDGREVYGDSLQREKITMWFEAVARLSAG